MRIAVVDKNVISNSIEQNKMDVPPFWYYIRRYIHYIRTIRASIVLCNLLPIIYRLVVFLLPVNSPGRLKQNFKRFSFNRAPPPCITHNLAKPVFFSR